MLTDFSFPKLDMPDAVMKALVKSKMLYQLGDWNLLVMQLSYFKRLSPRGQTLAKAVLI